MASKALTLSIATRKSVACHICGDKNHVEYLQARGYDIVQCRNCGLWYVSPQPTSEELRQFYASYDDGEQWRKGEEYFNRGVRRAIQRCKKAGSVLDVGCGSGNFLRCMKEAGFSVFGIEASEGGSEFAGSEHGIQVYRGMIEDFLNAERAGQFDIITLLNVLEHLTDPVHILRQLQRMLAADGLLVVVVPDARFHDLVGRFRRRIGIRDPFWLEQPTSFLSGFKLPDHLCSFQPRTLISLLQRSGFNVVGVQNAPVVLNASPLRNLAKGLIRWTSGFVHFMTFRRVLVGYSTLLLARKGSN